MSFPTQAFRLTKMAIAPVVALIALAGVPALAQSASVKVAVIDVERILTESSRGKAALDEIESLRKQKQSEGEGLQKEIVDLRQRLDEGRLSLSEDKINDLQKQLEDKSIALKRFQDDANRELSKKRDQVLKTVEDSVFPVINQIGKEQGYTLIFNKFSSGLVYADDAVDITDDVIERYNQGQGSGGQNAGDTGGQ
jgi:outer membrane protein